MIIGIFSVCLRLSRAPYSTLTHFNVFFTLFVFFAVFHSEHIRTLFTRIICTWECYVIQITILQHGYVYGFLFLFFSSSRIWRDMKANEGCSRTLLILFILPFVLYSNCLNLCRHHLHKFRTKENCERRSRTPHQPNETNAKMKRKKTAKWRRRKNDTMNAREHRKWIEWVPNGLRTITKVRKRISIDGRLVGMTTTMICTSGLDSSNLKRTARILKRTIRKCNEESEKRGNRIVEILPWFPWNSTAASAQPCTSLVTFAKDKIKL